MRKSLWLRHLDRLKQLSLNLLLLLPYTQATTTRPKDRGVVVQEPSEFRVSQETQLQGSKDKGKARGLFMYMKARKEGSKVLEKTPKVAEKDAWNEEAAGKKPAERNP
ncbi:hypothetical protein Tco_1447806 [Tanacetum coccineum]